MLTDNLPRQGGCYIAAVHISYVDIQFVVQCINHSSAIMDMLYFHHHRYVLFSHTNLCLLEFITATHNFHVGANYYVLHLSILVQYFINLVNLDRTNLDFNWIIELN